MNEKESPLLLNRALVKVVFRLGVIELGIMPYYIRYYNKTSNGGPYHLNLDQAKRWNEWLKKAKIQFDGRYIVS